MIAGEELNGFAFELDAVAVEVDDANGFAIRVVFAVEEVANGFATDGVTEFAAEELNGFAVEEVNEFVVEELNGFPVGDVN